MSRRIREFVEEAYAAVKDCHRAFKEFAECASAVNVFFQDQTEGHARGCDYSDAVFDRYDDARGVLSERSATARTALD